MAESRHESYLRCEINVLNRKGMTKNQGLNVRGKYKQGTYPDGLSLAKSTGVGKSDLKSANV